MQHVPPLKKPRIEAPEVEEGIDAFSSPPKLTAIGDGIPELLRSPDFEEVKARVIAEKQGHARNKGQYATAELEGGSSRLEKFQKLMGMKKAGNRSTQGVSTKAPTLREASEMETALTRQFEEGRMASFHKRSMMQ
eukprot:Sspe_Gene.101758::Locus_76390_Transcript_1_1_Confidence_1.000_Length_576::g.101758::m.101758